MSQNENKTHTHKFLSKKRGYVWEMRLYGIVLMLVLLTEICQDDQMTSIEKEMEGGPKW
jgi:ABC-type microcin C transport system permease subunit YejE